MESDGFPVAKNPMLVTAV